MNVLLKKMAKAKCFTVNTNFDRITDFVKYLNNGSAKILDLLDFSGEFEEMPIDSKEFLLLKSWQTYSNCYELVYTLENDKLFCVATIWEGTDGIMAVSERDKGLIKFRLKVECNISILSDFENYVNNAFESAVHKDYLDHLKLEERNWKNKVILNLLS